MYKSKLDIKETQLAIQELKYVFEKEFYKSLNLYRATSPLFVESSSLINDGLNGEKPVSFIPKNLNKELEIVHSLAKWKRWALKQYNFDVYEGIWTNMNAIRKEEDLDQTHSYYVDQWDWELIINKNDRTIDFLKNTVNKIYQCIRYTENQLNFKFPQLSKKLPDELKFISALELYNLYPNLKPEEREKEFAKKHKAIFIYSIGYKLPDGVEHSKRAFDYDDWDLNGDLIVYDQQFNRAIELSSMGIRVNKDSLLKQAKLLSKNESNFAEYHNKIIENELPFTIGGGVGQSRLSMFLLEKYHIGEVQVGIWDETTINDCKDKNIKLL